jgi:MYXO-CTERM domain-containing protein
VRIHRSDRASSQRRTTWLLAGAAALAAAPAACSHDSGGSSSEREPSVATSATAANSAAAAKIAVLRARFPAALAAAADVRLLDDPAAETIRAVLAAPSSRLATIDLPRRADGAVHLTDDTSGLHITFALEGAAPAPAAIDGGLALYPGAAPGGGDVIHVPRASGTEDFVHFERAPAKEELRYRVDVSRAAGLRLFADTLELLDASGTPLLRVAPPFVIDAQGRRSEASLAVEGCAADTSALAPFGRPVTSPGAAFCTVSVGWRGAHVTYPVLVDPVWGITLNTLIAKRVRHTMTLLNPSDVKSLALVAGGFSTVNGVPLKTAEIYDPLSRRFTATGSMSVARGAHTATLLTKVAKPAQLGPAEPVLIAGGADSGGLPIASVEIYDPATGLFQIDPTPMAFPRFGHSATLFADNTVLLAGGTTLPLNQPTPTASVYTFTSLVGGVLTSTLTSTSGTMSFSRTGLASARLANGQVLITGGFVLAGGSLQALQSAELYDPTANAFIPIPTAGGGILQMSVQRGFHTATPIGGGLVLIAGGLTNTAGGTNPTAVDLYADGSVGAVTGFVNQATPLSLATGRASHTATLLATGDVLLAGGFSAGSAVSAEEVFVAKTSTFKLLGALVPMTPRGDHAALLVNAGDSIKAGHTVLVTGGATSSTNNTAALDSAQILFAINGNPCSIGDECLSGFCADGVCCDTACDQECYACSAATKQSGQDGTCSFAKQGSDPRVQCLNELEVHTQCDGKGSTEQTTLTKDCKPGVCGADNLCSTSCMTSDNCSKTGFCDLTAPSDAGPNLGTCSPKRINSTICTADEQCVTGKCVDGLCCDLACDGQCQACNNPGFPGKCTTFGSEAAPEQPHKDPLHPREACSGVTGDTVTSCAGRCTGAADPILCQYPGTNKTLQGTTCTDIPGAPSKLTNYPCDGQGTNTETTSDCGGFLCADASSCKTSCVLDTECLKDWVCTDKVCQKLTGPLCDGVNVLRKPGGNSVCPDHYTCPAGATACRTDCDAVTDCTDGLVCNNDRKCVERPGEAVITACSVSVPGSSSRGAIPWLLGLAGLVTLRRRSKRSAR